MKTGQDSRFLSKKTVRTFMHIFTCLLMLIFHVRARFEKFSAIWHPNYRVYCNTD